MPIKTPKLVVYNVYIIPTLLHDAMKTNNIHKLPQVFPHFFIIAISIASFWRQKIRTNNQREQQSLQKGAKPASRLTAIYHKSIN